jgi:hypothetical protein
VGTLLVPVSSYSNSVRYGFARAREEPVHSGSGLIDWSNIDLLRTYREHIVKHIIVKHRENISAHSTSFGCSRGGFFASPVESRLVEAEGFPLEMAGTVVVV